MNPFYNSIFNIFENIINHESPIDKGILGHGIILKQLDLPNNRDRYGLLYRNDIQLSDHIFRIGGMSNGFNNKPYTMLIDYGVITSKLTDCKDIKSFGDHCIIDINAVIVFRSTNIIDHPYYLQGVIAVCNNKYYNLLTGKLILEGSTTIKSKNYLFVEHSYSGYNKELPLGVYKIDWNTGEYEYFK
jgi:hypothetical protein